MFGETSEKSSDSRAAELLENEATAGIAVLCTSGSAGIGDGTGTESEVGCELPKSLKSSPSSVVTGDFAVGTNDADGTFGLASKSPMGADSFAGTANCGDERHTRHQNTIGRREAHTAAAQNKKGHFACAEKPRRAPCHASSYSQVMGTRHHSPRAQSSPHL